MFKTGVFHLIVNYQLSIVNCAKGGVHVDKKPQRIAKEEQVRELEQLLKESEGTVLSDYRGITVTQDVVMRAKLREAGVDYRIVKNTLLKIACNNVGYTDLDPFFEGPTAIAFGSDPVQLAKLLSAAIAENKKGAIKAGLLGDNFINAAQINNLAKLPPREVLLAQVAGAFQAPLAAFAGVTSGILRQLVTVVDAVREQKAALEN